MQIKEYQIKARYSEVCEHNIYELIVVFNNDLTYNYGLFGNIKVVNDFVKDLNKIYNKEV